MSSPRSRASSWHLSKISFTLLSLPGVVMTSPAIFESHSNLSLLIPSGRMAIDWQPRSAELNAPPRQKLPVDGHAAFCRLESKEPVTSAGARHPYVAPTLWAPVGNHLPTSAT